MKKEDLINWGVKDIYFDGDRPVIIKEALHHNGWHDKGDIYKALIREIKGHNKYVLPKTYLGVVLNKRIIPLHRVIYAWFNGEVDDNLEIDHIDHNPFNNTVENLRQVDRKTNLNSKLVQNNQWAYKEK